ncbi:MAG: ATP-binding protein [Sphaerochaetaceae bacterium]|nr:ATP-binding protein [Sphaerochaetaceae bacterium]
MNTVYMTRIADEIIKKKLDIRGAILIEGAKWCGKTMTASQIAKSKLLMQDPDNRDSYLKAADTKPSLLLQGDTPRLLDEWQMAPVLWDAVRFMVDKRGLPGQFILTGSTVPRGKDEEGNSLIHHSGTGRIGRMRMRPMSLWESRESNGTVSLRDLFQGVTEIGSFSELSIEDIAYAIGRGGWPAAVIDQKDTALQHAVDYVESIIHSDISRVDGVSKDPQRVRMLMRSLARNVSTVATIKTIRDNMALGAGDSTLSEKSISQYLSALSNLFVTEDLPAWNPAIRSKTAIRTSVKRHFVDPSIAMGTLRLTPSRLLEDFAYFGFLFESLCTRDLRVYAESLDGEVFHYRDGAGLEADAIICLNDDRWAAVEIKLGSKEIEMAAEHLLELKHKVNTEKMNDPSFLMVITGGEVAYRRDDGVFIVPLGCLKQ